AIAGAELVFHAAAKITIDDRPDPAAEATNVAGTRNVIEACRAHGVRRLVRFSSVHARGEGSAYERSKALAEREVLAAVDGGLDAVVVQPAAVVGPFDHKPSYIGRFLLMLARNAVP